MLFEFIFVRHGESCANAIQKAVTGGIIKHKYYLDPELTSKGVAYSSFKYFELITSFNSSEGKSPFKEGHYTIGSSPLLRAQETAYYMLGKHKKDKPINVMPYLGEIMTPPFTYQFPDNIPQSAENQMEILKDLTNPPFFKGKDEREEPYAPNFQNFLEWAKTHLEWFTKGHDNIYRAIIFTHSNLLQSGFPSKHLVNPPLKPLHKDKLDNNDFLVTIYNPDNVKIPEKTVLDAKAVYPAWHYFDTRDIRPSQTIACGKEKRCKKELAYFGRIEVPITTPCAASGGKRKTRRRLSRRRLSRRFKK